MAISLRCKGFSADPNAAERDDGVRLAAAQIVRLLLDRGADKENANNDGDTPLYYACSKGHLEVARLLLDRGADVEKAGEDGGTLLLYGARFDGHLEVARLFLDHGADKDAADEDG